jgi:uncharacterized membrane protein
LNKSGARSQSFFKGDEILFSSYTSNQKSAIATFLFAALWALISLEIAIRMGLQSPSALTVFAIMTIIAWILIPFYLKKIKPVFIIGIIVLVLGLIGLFASPGNPPWYSFSNPISVVKEGSFVLDGLACIYFSYKSYKELSRTDIP